MIINGFLDRLICLSSLKNWLLITIIDSKIKSIWIITISNSQIIALPISTIARNLTNRISPVLDGKKHNNGKILLSDLA